MTKSDRKMLSAAKKVYERGHEDGRVAPSAPLRRRTVAYQLASRVVDSRHPADDLEYLMRRHPNTAWGTVAAMIYDDAMRRGM